MDQKCSEKKNPESSEEQNLNLLLHIGNYLHDIYNYLHSIYIVLDIISNLEMIRSMQEDMHSLYANTTTFYIRDLHILEFWYAQGS